MNTEPIQYIHDANGEPIGVFVPIAIWRDKEAQLRPATNGNGAETHTNGVHPAGNAIVATVSKTRRQRLLTPEQERLKEELDRVYATVDSRLEPEWREAQAKAVQSEATC